jgi:alanine dehydrogenase
MNVGTIKEAKEGEDRVGLTPAGAGALAQTGHTAIVERGAGEGSGFHDDEYRRAGATLVESPQEVAGRCDLLVKVKELLPPEFSLLRPGLILFSFLHLPALPDFTSAVLTSGATAIAFENVQKPDGSLPLLTPMSQVAGRMAAEMGAQLLKRPGPGRGKLLSGVPGVAPARAVVLGSGSVATAACRALMGFQARVTVMSPDLRRLAYLEELFGGRIATRVVSPVALAEELAGADLLITGVQVPGAVTPKVVTREMVRSMGPGAVIVDVDIDLGGAVETARHTSHADPVYIEEGVIHYCVPNMPGAVPRTATEALAAATLPYVLDLAQDGLGAIAKDSSLAAGVNVIKGKVTHQRLAKALGLPYTPLAEVL